MLSRRRFLQTSSLISLSPLLPTILARTARAAGAAADAPSLVVIQLDGGNDGINTVVPFGDDAYGRARDKLRLGASRIHKLNDHVGLHPGMKAAKELFDDGRLIIVQGVGYPNPDRSHFRSMRIWQTARFNVDELSDQGWLGRTMDHEVSRGVSSTPADAIFVGNQETPVALWGRRSTALALSRAEDIALQISVPMGSTPASLPGADSLESFVSRQVLTAYAAAEEFKKQQARSRSSSASNYPGTELAQRLKLISQLLKSDCQARVFYTIQAGYDTHSAQLDTHDRLLREFSESLRAFLDDLRAAGLQDRVLILAFSEFGRRVRENDSQGTDHGTAGPVFLAGNAVRGGLIGSAPDLSDLEEGDLKFQIDFRRIYATVLDRWLKVSSREIMREEFETLSIV